MTIGIDPAYEERVVPPYATCGDCASCRRFDGWSDDPFEFVRDEGVYKMLRDDYGLCEQDGESPTVVELDMSAHDVDCPCSGDGWEERSVPPWLRPSS